MEGLFTHDKISFVHIYILAKLQAPMNNDKSFSLSITPLITGLYDCYTLNTIYVKT